MGAHWPGVCLCVEQLTLHTRGWVLVIFSCMSIYLSVCMPPEQRLKNLSSTSAMHLHDAVVFTKVPESITSAFECWDAAPHTYSQASKQTSIAGGPALKGVQVKVDQDMLTAGHARKVRSELYEEPWSESCDFMLVGDLMEACKVPDMCDQGVVFKHSMQAGQCNNAASLLQHPWFTWSVRFCDNFPVTLHC